MGLFCNGKRVTLVKAVIEPKLTKRFQVKLRHSIVNSLGALLLAVVYYLFYDICEVLGTYCANLYADDTKQYINGKDHGAVVNTTNSELCKLINYLKSNRITLYINKTKCILSQSKINSRIAV